MLMDIIMKVERIHLIPTSLTISIPTKKERRQEKEKKATATDFAAK